MILLLTPARKYKEQICINSRLIHHMVPTATGTAIWYEDSFSCTFQVDETVEQIMEMMDGKSITR